MTLLRDYSRSYDPRRYSYDRSGLSGENLKRHILAMSQGVDISKKAPSAPPRISFLSNDLQFQVFGGVTTPVTLHPDGRFAYQAILALIPSKIRVFHSAPLSEQRDSLVSLPIRYRFPLQTTVSSANGTNQSTPMRRSLIGDNR